MHVVCSGPPICIDADGITESLFGGPVLDFWTLRRLSCRLSGSGVGWTAFAPPAPPAVQSRWRLNPSSALFLDTDWLPVSLVGGASLIKSGRLFRLIWSAAFFPLRPCFLAVSAHHGPSLPPSPLRFTCPSVGLPRPLHGFHVVPPSARLTPPHQPNPGSLLLRHGPAPSQSGSFQMEVVVFLPVLRCAWLRTGGGGC